MPTFTDRVLRKFGLLPPLSVMNVVAVQKDKAKRLEDMQKIPRYPPFMEGLPIYTPDELLATQHEFVDAVRRLVADAELLDNHYNPAMLRLASFVHLLPASQMHHHRGVGGLLRHSLEVGFLALQQTEGKLIRGITAPQQRRVFEPHWRLAVFLAGICHDLGKVVTDLTVTDRANEQKWQPYLQGIYDWAMSQGIDSYFLHWHEGRGKSHTNVSSTLIDAVIGRKSFNWISDGSTDAVICMTESLNNNPGQSNQIHNLVVKADQLSVERDLKSMGVAMAGYEIGVPIERYLTDIMRRLLQEGIWRINEPGARVWSVAGKTYLVWPMAGEEIACRTRDENIPGLPKTPDGILDMMVERGIAFLREGKSDPYFYIAPDVLIQKIPDLKLRCIGLRDQSFISIMPIASVAGTVSGRLDTVLPTPLQRICGTSEHNQQTATQPAQPQRLSCTPEIPQTSIPASLPERLSFLAAEIEKQPAHSGILLATLRADELSMEQLTGSMGKLLRALIEDFRTGKKSFEALTTYQNHQLYLMWPQTLAGYGYTPKQILDGLTEHGWMEAMSDTAKAGNMHFADGEAKAIRLKAAISQTFLNAIQPKHVTHPDPTREKAKTGTHTDTRLCFALSAGDVTSRHFELNGKKIELKPGLNGLPTIRDFDVLIYCAQLRHGNLKNDFENQNLDFQFSAQDFLKSCGRGIGGAQIQGLLQALDRLGSSEIFIRNQASSGAKSTEPRCKLITHTTKLSSDDGDERINLTISGKLFCMIPSRMTCFIFAGGTHPDYFKLKPLQRVLYWLAIINCDVDDSFTTSIEQLHWLTGASSPLRNFKGAIQEAAEHPLLDYQLTTDQKVTTISFRQIQTA